MLFCPVKSSLFRYSVCLRSYYVPFLYVVAVTIDSLRSPLLRRCARHCSRVRACLFSGDTWAFWGILLTMFLAFLLLLRLCFLSLATSPCGLYLDIKVPSILRAFVRIFEEPLLCYRKNQTKPNQTRPNTLCKPQSDLCSLFLDS
jgi:hypothetical protein